MGGAVPHEGGRQGGGREEGKRCMCFRYFEERLKERTRIPIGRNFAKDRLSRSRDEHSKAGQDSGRTFTGYI